MLLTSDSHESWKGSDMISCFNKLWNVFCGDCFEAELETEMDDLEYAKPKAAENSTPPPHFFRSPAYYASCQREKEKTEKESRGSSATQHEEISSPVSSPVESVVTHRIPHNIRSGHVPVQSGVVSAESEAEEDSFVLL